MKFRLSTPASPPGKPQGTEDNDDEGGSHPAAAGSTNTTAPSSNKKNTNKQKMMGLNATWRHGADQKVVGLKQYGLDSSTYENRRKLLPSSAHSRRSLASLTKSKSNNKANNVKFSVEEKEEEVLEKAIRNPFLLLYLGILAALKVMVYYMITMETIISCAITVGLTVYWYNAYDENSDWDGGGMDFVLLAFALTAPISAAMTMAFNRRERALITIADFRSWSYHLYLGHSLWDWPDNGGRAAADVDWVEHCDAVMAQLVGIGDELSRFLSLPTTSRSRHRMTKQGRREAARTIEVAYHLLESMSTQRLTRLVMYSERLKKIGLPSGEASRLRQYERFLSGSIEQLRMVKMYRTPQAFRSFARIFTLVLPPFYAPTFAQVARDVNSLGVGISFGIITALGLTMLFESLQILEDPFVAFLALDGIDVREEFEVLHFAQLLSTRKLVFPDAPEYPAGRRAALTSKSKKPGTGLGLPPMQIHHHHHRQVSSLPSLPDLTEEVDTGNLDESEGSGFVPPVVGVVGGVDQESLISLDDEDNDAEEELGPQMDDQGEASFIRLTGFVDDEEIESPRPRLGTSERGLRSRRHVREWSRG